MGRTATRTLVSASRISEPSLVVRGSGPGRRRLDGTNGGKQSQRLERYRRRQLDRG